MQILNERIEFLRNNPVFWSRLGFCYDPPGLGSDGKPIVFSKDFSRFSKYHKDFFKAGIRVHTSILHSGWVGVNKYDYSLTDRVLEEIFRDNEDIYYIPRIKLNPPVEWTAQNPEDVFVYFEPLPKEEIIKLINTEKQDWLGYEAPNGYYQSGDYIDTRPNVNGRIALQSFSSEKWLHDAGIALKKLLEHIRSSCPYADRIIGYHIAYGASGETCLWGRSPGRYGDYGINNRRAFYKWGLSKYKTPENLAKAWNQEGINEDNTRIPAVEERYGLADSMSEFFREKSRICIDYDEFMSCINARDAEYFCKIVKEFDSSKLTGVFYGYFMYVYNAAYTGHLAVEKLLNSEYVDFFAAPKNYHRSGVGEAGGEMCPALSVNRKKLWVDELDNRTHLAIGEAKAETLKETATVLWREFCKNLSRNSGFWWMDLGGGWFDSDEILNEVQKAVKINNLLRKEEHRSISDVLIVVDEESLMYFKVNQKFFMNYILDFITDINESGVLADTYRLKDLEVIDLSRYKLIIFANTFKITNWNRIINKIRSGTTMLFNHAAGIWKESFDINNVKEITGFCISDGGFINGYPKIKVTNGCPVYYDKNGKEIILRLRRRDGGINYINCGNPGKETLRKIAEDAGCYMHTNSLCTVYGDNRIIGFFPKNEIKEKIVFKVKGRYKEIISGIEYKDKADVLLRKDEPAVFIHI